MLKEKYVCPTDLFSSVAEDEAAAHRYAAHLSELFNTLDPEMIGSAYAAALEKGDWRTAVRLCAVHFRRTDDVDLDFLKTTARYDKREAKRAVNGGVTVVEIDWDFPDGKIDYLFDASQTTGTVNPEWVWQLNRHGFWQEMACAYAETGNEKYARAFTRQLLDWLAQTECGENWNGVGSAWRTIECGLRLSISWPISFFAFRRSKAFGDLPLLLMIASMRRQAEHLLAHYTGQNWLMIETDGLYYFACLFPEFIESKNYRNAAFRLFWDGFSGQILPDGIQDELTSDYRWGVFDSAIRILALARVTGFGDELPDGFTDLLMKIVHANMLLSTPGLTQPRTNDTYTVPTAFIMRRAKEYLPYDPLYDYVLSNRQSGTPPTGDTASVFLPYAGFCAMRSDWGADATYLCFDVGPLGMAHVHQDMLNINLYKGEEELIFDDGGGHYEFSEMRRYALSGYDHNTVLVDGMAQNRTEPKKYNAPVPAGWKSNETFDYACGTYDGPFGAEGKRSAVHKREVRFCKPDFFLVRDTLIPCDQQRHSYELLFQLDTLKVKNVDGYQNAVLTDFGRKYDLLIVPLDDPDATAAQWHFASARKDPYRGWYVGRYDKKTHPATTVSRTVENAGEYCFETLLFPIARGEKLPRIERRQDGKLEIRFRGKAYLLTDKLDR